MSEDSDSDYLAMRAVRLPFRALVAAVARTALASTWPGSPEHEQAARVLAAALPRPRGARPGAPRARPAVPAGRVWSLEPTSARDSTERPVSLAPGVPWIGPLDVVTRLGRVTLAELARALVRSGYGPCPGYGPGPCPGPAPELVHESGQRPPVAPADVRCGSRVPDNAQWSALVAAVCAALASRDENATGKTQPG